MQMEDTQVKSVESSANDYDMFLLIGHHYRFMMMTGQVLEVLLTGYGVIYEETFYCKVGRAMKQFYYWDVDYAQDITNEKL